MFKKTAGNQAGFGSVALKLFAFIKAMLGNERGEVGNVAAVDPVLPGTDDAAGLGDQGGVDGQDANTFYQPTDDEFSPAKPAQATQPEGGNVDDPAAAVDDGKPVAPETTPAVPDPATTKPPEQQPDANQPEITVEGLQSSIQDMTAQLEEQRTIAEFYAKQYNETVGIRPDQAPTQVQPGQGSSAGQAPPAAPVEQPAAATLPENIKQPNDWESQEDEAAYINHMVESRATGAAKEVQDAVMPTLQYHQSAITEFQQATAMMDFIMSEMPGYKERTDKYNEMMSSVEDELFTFTPGRRDVVGFKNQALLKYFQAQPNPRKAMLAHARRKNAGKDVQKGVRTATAATLKNITNQPKGPTMPVSSGGGANPAGSVPPQTANQASVEDYLQKSGLI